MITYLIASTDRSAANGLIERRECLELGGFATLGFWSEIADDGLASRC